MSLAIHATVVFALLTAHFAVESGVTPVRSSRVRLVAPAARVPVRRFSIRTPPRAPAVPIQAAIPRLSLPPLAPPMVHPPPVFEAPPVLAETSPKPLPLTPLPPSIVRPPPQVQTGGFSSVSASAVPAARTIQVGAAGFGSAGVAPASAERRPPVVTAAGFGDSGVSSTAAGGRAAVRASGFGDAVSATAPASRPRASVPPSVTVALILEKPRPAYTEEARRLQIEGEVQLEILFGASGEIQILRVVRGLGHGLDENAAQAARTIRFLPARRDGRPVDSTATVHIIFQLAS